MQYKSTYFFLLLGVLLSLNLSAQSSCEYILELFDSFGDGWNGAELSVSINEEDTTVYTLFNDDNDSFNRFLISVEDGDIVRFAYSGGTFENEVTYQLLDPNCNIIFEDGTNPTEGDAVFQDTLFCPDCLVIKETSVSISNIRHNRANVNYLQRVTGGTALIEYGISGFVPGTGITVASPASPERIVGLEENTAYDVYIRNLCTNNDTTDYVGPFSFTTLYANDVGVTNILSPISGCDLSASTALEIDITNFGGIPQTLLPMGFSVNGIPQPVGQPQDGVFTGVLGTDSTFTFEFDRTFNFSEPGIYEVAFYTQLEADSVLTNDTFSITVISVPTIAEYPYQEDFEDGPGGWTVDQNSVNSSWEFGAPAGTIISQAAQGDSAWVTNLSGFHNVNEVSYLLSPCLDFSNMTEDPVLQFALYSALPTCCDEAWVETSVDGGETWEKLGTDASGINWYNDTFSDWWDGNAGVDGWHLVSHPLTGLAGITNARVRIVMNGDFSATTEGIAIDNVIIAAPAAIDLAGASVSRPTLVACGSEEDVVTLTIINLGQDSVTSFTVNYQVNDGDIVSETVDTTIQPGETVVYTFMTTFNSTTPGSYNVIASVDIDGDQVSLNDFANLSFASALSLPYAEDFEGGAVPADWEVDTDVFTSTGHGAPSVVITDNLYSFDNFFNAATPAFGPIESGDSLFFDYRYVDFFSPNAPTVLGITDSLIVEISTDCGLTYEEIGNVTGLTHMPTDQMQRLIFSLEDYVDQAIRVRFRAVWGGGVDGTADYYLDIDNILVKRCGAITADATIQGATGVDNPDGTITVEPSSGIGPYTYQWDTGDTGSTISGLLAGSYTVTITDAQGCSDAVAFFVSVVVDVIDHPGLFGEVRLAPNPTNGQTNLSATLRQSTDIEVIIHNSLGQRILRYTPERTDRLDQQIDLSNQAAGLYIVHVRAGDEVVSLRLIKTDN